MDYPILRALQELWFFYLGSLRRVSSSTPPKPNNQKQKEQFKYFHLSLFIWQAFRVLSWSGVTGAGAPALQASILLMLICCV